MNTVLGVITDWELAGQVVVRTRQLASAYGARVCIYCPVTDQLEEMNRYIGFDNYEAVKEEILADNRSRLDHLVGEEDIDMALDWQSHPYKGVALQAEERSASLIVMAMNEHHVIGDLLHKADDWHLLRAAPCPVLLLSRSQHPFRSVVAAVDSLDESEANQALSARVLDEGRALADVMKLPMTVISVVPEPTYIYGDMAASSLLLDYRGQAENAARQNQRALLARLGVKSERQMVAVGPVEKVLEEAVADAGILVVGTISNKGWKGLLVGNTAERILSRVNGDMLVVN
ncbi:MAG: universal stress protein [Porticoccaceae bacterium]